MHSYQFCFHQRWSIVTLQNEHIKSVCWGHKKKHESCDFKKKGELINDDWKQAWKLQLKKPRDFTEVDMGGVRNCGRNRKDSLFIWKMKWYDMKNDDAVLYNKYKEKESESTDQNEIRNSPNSDRVLWSK